MSDHDDHDFEDDEEDELLNYWDYYELVRQDDELFIVETIITQYEDMVAAQSNSETYYHAVSELDDEEIVAELMEIGFNLEEGEAVDVRDLILAADYEEDLEDLDDEFIDDADDSEDD